MNYCTRKRSVFQRGRNGTKKQRNDSFVSNQPRWLLTALIVLLGLCGGTQDAKAGWGGNNYLKTSYDPNTGEVTIIMCLYNSGSGFWKHPDASDGVFLTCNGERIARAWIERLSDGCGIHNTDINKAGFGGEMKWAEQHEKQQNVWGWGGTSTWARISWFIPTNLYNTTLEFKMKGSWFPSEDRSLWDKCKEEATSSLKPSDVGGVFHSLKPSIDLQPDGSFKVEWDKDGGFSELDKKDSVTFHLGNNGEQKASAAANKKELSYTPSACESPASYSLKHRIELGKMVFEDIKRIQYTGCPYPSGLGVTTDVTKKQVVLRWLGNNMNSTASDGYWAIYRKEGTGSERYLGYVSKYSYTYTDKDSQLTYDKKYTYCVKWVRSTWNNNTSISALKANIDVRIERQFDMKLKAISSKDAIELSWIVPNYPISSYENEGLGAFEIYRSENGKSTKIATVNATSGTTQYTYTDTSSEYNPLGGSNVNHDYYIVAHVLESNKFGTIQSQPLSAKVKGGSEFVSFSASKGEYDGSVKLNWAIDRPIIENDKGNTYEVYRRVADKVGNKPYELQYRMNSAESFIGWSDDKVKTGIYYEYKIKCIVKDAEKPEELYITDIGFSKSTGTVTGRITYGSGTAVQKVPVLLKNKDSLDLQYKALKFGGEGITQFNAGKVFLPNQDAWSLQFYIKPQGDADSLKCLIALDDSVRVGLVKTATGEYNPFIKIGKVVAAFYDQINLSCNKYQNISLVNDGSNLIFKLVDETAQGPKVINQSKGVNINGNMMTMQLGDTLDNSFNGYIDDLRLWSKALSNEDILDNYDRILTGNEKKLIGYWTFDEGLRQFFDYARNGSDFYSHHGELISMSSSDENLPSAEQLGLKAYTDDDGNYIIQGVPYSGDGTTYTVAPLFGSHRFEPAQQILYVSTSSLVHNGTTFKDISSFKVSGRVTYEHGNFPVEGVTVSIDGNPASRDGELITSDASGDFIVDVPIGEHFISLSKQGHDFAEEGRFPANKLVKYDFQSDITTPIEFVDVTTVRVAGRVSGGSIEAAKPLGFGQSVANIGQATIKLEPVSSIDYRLNTNEEEDISLAGNDTIKSDVKLVKNSKEIVITSDPKTGEFLALLPPISYKITDVSTKSVTKEQFKLENISQIEPDENASKQDTLITEDGKKLSFAYHARVDFKYTSPAVFEVKDASNEDGAFGEKAYTVKYKEGEEEKEATIPLYSGTANDIKYALGHPVFLKNKAYTFSVKAYESYENKDESKTVVSQVPLADQLISVDDQIAMSEYYVNNDSVATQPRVLTLNDKGIAVYQFTGGYPNLNDDLLKSMQFTFDKDGISYQWEKDGFKAYVLGDQSAEGTNFITQGPDQVDFVLRDPPGSNSFSYVGEGSVITTTDTDLKAEGTHLAQNFTLSFGGDTYLMAAPMGIGIMTHTKANADVTEDFTFDYTTTKSTEVVSTLETTTQISTSGEPDYVGDMADVFIGRSTNLLFGASNNLNFYTEAAPQGTTAVASVVADGKTFYLYPKNAISMGVKFSTRFIYTKNHITGYLIPNIQELRNKQITIDPAYFSEEAINQLVNNDSIYHYYSKVAQDNPNFGEEGAYWAIAPTGDKTTLAVNEVKECNSWIAGWEKYLKNNEDEKLLVIREGVAKNISFDAGSSKSYSMTQTNDTTKTTEVTWNTDITAGTNTGFEILGIGSKASVNLGYAHQTGITKDSVIGHSVELGYELVDTDQGDYYSVDVYDKGTSGFIFRTRGGQSSCPWEGATMTEYQEGDQKELSTATMQIEKPALVINNSTQTDIPTGREASFELKMSNNSEANLAVAYKLWVDEETNPNGLALSIDGTPLGSGRQFTINSGQDGTLKKILTVRQTKNDVLEYDDVVLHLTSTCQDDPNSDLGWIHSDAKFTVHFKPSSSPLTLNISSGNRVLNSKTGNELHLEVTDYDRTFAGFKYIHLKYKPANSNAADWQTFKTYTNREDLVDAQAELITGSTLSFDLEMDNLTYPDQTYLFCAFSEGNSTIASEEITVIKDMKGPQLLGSPTPSNGILTPDGDISVVFNENINTSIMIADNVTAKGVLNGHKLAHNTGLSFVGGNPAATELPVVLTGGSFTFETWLKHTPGTKGTLFRHGTASQGIKIGFTQNSEGRDLLEVVVNGQQLLSDPLDNVTGWQYLSIAYNADNTSISAYALYETTNKTMLNAAKLEAPYTGEGRLYVGEGLTGVMQEVSLWSKARQMADLSDKDQSKSGNEKDLAGYWPLNECTGTVAVDKARAHHLVVPNASFWYIGAENKSYHFGGNGYITLQGGMIPLTSDDNFALEFWFKGAASQLANATLFSCGKGMGDFDSSDKLSIGFAGKNLMLQAKGQSYQLGNGLYLDDSWHHLALNVVRGGSAIVYIDGKQAKQLAASNIGGMAGGELLLGACKYRTENDADGGIQYAFVEDGYFTGNIDEVRIWKATLSAESIRLNMNSRLNGDEAGLVAYYPFEEEQKNQGIAFMAFSLKDKTKTAADAIATNTTGSDIAPNLKEVRELESVPVSYVASDNKIVINIQDGMTSRIENCTLEFTIDRVQDLNGNALPGAVKWTAYVDMNRMKWDRESVSVVQEVLHESKFDVTVSNQSGKEETYVLSNLPAWLTASKTQGSLKPLASEKITFTVAESTPVGSYEGTVYLTGNNQIDEPLIVSLKVTGEKPDWTVNPKDFEGSMNLVGQLTIEGQYQEDGEDIVGAFIGEQCVGLASPVLSEGQNSYYLYMSVYGNPEHKGKVVTFRLWDAGTGRVYPTIELTERGTAKTVQFTDGLILGSITEPVVLNAIDRIEQTLYTSKGWNWISVNVNNLIGEPDNLSQFKTKIGTAGLQLKGREKFIQYSNGSWRGSLTSLETTGMYMLQTSADSKLNFVGRMVNPSEETLTLSKGWNWIGYTPQFSATVKEALAGMEAASGDMLKGQMGFVTYDGSAWRGNLSYLTPSEGYMYYSAANDGKSFVYPSQSSTLRSAALRSATANGLKWNADAGKYATNMSVIGVVTVNGEEAESNQYELGVFSGNECRGSVRLAPDAELGRALVYLTIHGENNDALNFRLYDHQTGSISTAESPVNVVYKSDAILGTLDLPYQFAFTGVPTANDELSADRLGIHPTLAATRVWFTYQPELIERLEIIHGNGSVVKRMDKVTDNFIDVSDLATGICYLRITYKGKVYIHEFIKK